MSCLVPIPRAPKRAGMDDIHWLFPLWKHGQKEVLESPVNMEYVVYRRNKWMHSGIYVGTAFFDGPRSENVDKIVFKFYSDVIQKLRWWCNQSTFPFPAIIIAWSKIWSTRCKHVYGWIGSDHEAIQSTVSHVISASPLFSIESPLHILL